LGILAVSGLHINMFKSLIYPVNEIQNIKELANILGCGTGKFPTTYLGLLLKAKYKTKDI